MNSQDLHVMTLTVWAEARGESREGKVAVAASIFNRFNAKRWFSGQSLAETCQFPWQYSCWNKNDPNRAKLLALSPEKASYKTCQEAVLQAEQGLLLPEWWDRKVTHYFNPKAVAKTPTWAVGEPIAGVIGRHQFYRNID